MGHNLSNIACKECGKLFTPKLRQVYCTISCRGRANRGRYRAKHPLAPKLLFNKDCKICSISFTTTRSAQIYCSDCGIVAKAIRSDRDYRLKRFKKFEGGKNCVYCGINFMPKHTTLQKYCSASCRSEFYHGKIETKENNAIIKYFGTVKVDLECKKLIAIHKLMSKLSKFTKQQKKQAMIRINNGDTLAAYEY